MNMCCRPSLLATSHLHRTVLATAKAPRAAAPLKERSAVHRPAVITLPKCHGLQGARYSLRLQDWGGCAGSEVLFLAFVLVVNDGDPSLYLGIVLAEVEGYVVGSLPAAAVEFEDLTLRCEVEKHERVGVVASN